MQLPPVYPLQCSSEPTGCADPPRLLWNRSSLMVIYLCLMRHLHWPLPPRNVVPHLRGYILILSHCANYNTDKWHWIWGSPDDEELPLDPPVHYHAEPLDVVPACSSFAPLPPTTPDLPPSQPHVSTPPQHFPPPHQHTITTPPVLPYHIPPLSPLTRGLRRVGNKCVYTSYEEICLRLISTCKIAGGKWRNNGRNQWRWWQMRGIYRSVSPAVVIYGGSPGSPTGACMFTRPVIIKTHRPDDNLLRSSQVTPVHR